MKAYIAVVNKILPGWDAPETLEMSIAPQDKFWKRDAAVEQCQYCGVPFSLQQRRHHCRLCFDIFCAACCAETLDMALCAGAPVRQQRVCCQCFQDAEKNRELLEVRRVIRENRELEQRVKDIQAATEIAVESKRHEEAKLRLEAVQCGCNMEAINASIRQKMGSPVSLQIHTPAAHKFAPRDCADANDQLELAHRQLVMGLKVAQCRAQKALEKMELTLAVLREAICFGTSPWNVVLRYTGRFLTLRDVCALGQVSQTLRNGVERYQCERRCIMAQEPKPSWRPFLWQRECIRDAQTRKYLWDLTRAIQMRQQGETSESSETEDSDGCPLDMTLQAAVERRKWAQLQSPRDILATNSPWRIAYDFISSHHDVEQRMECEMQIQHDVTRTFGISSLRKNKKKVYHWIDTTKPSATQQQEVPLEDRKNALTNVLRAYASIDSEIGYCQGMDYVAALILSVNDWNECRAFWMLTSLLASPRFELDRLYAPELPLLNLRFFQLERLMARHLPELHQYLIELDYPVSMFSTGWFLTLFTNMEALPYHVVLRVLDGFFLSGWKHIFRVSLALLEALQHLILASAFEEIPPLFYDISEHIPLASQAERLLRHASRFKVNNAQLRALEREFEHSAPSTTPALPMRRRFSLPSEISTATANNGLQTVSRRSSAKSWRHHIDDDHDDGQKSLDPTRAATPPGVSPSNIRRSQSVAYGRSSGLSF